jgi:hypothetical protein
MLPNGRHSPAVSFGADYAGWRLAEFPKASLKNRQKSPDQRHSLSSRSRFGPANSRY